MHSEKGITMELLNLKCPACGSAKGLERLSLKGESYLHCAYCGGRFIEHSAEREYEKLESTIKKGLGSVVDEALVRTKTESYYNLRSMLYTKITAKYTDSAAILNVSRDILAIAPHDFLAEFFEIANSGNESEVSEYINKIDVNENALLIDLVLDFIIKSLKAGYITATAALLERCGSIFTPEKKQEYLTRFENEAKKVEEGIYEYGLSRDVFLAYSSKDMPEVLDVLELIEENGLTCFAAFRNLQHGRDAVANYEKALHEAIDNCSIFVFISSENSRSFGCDAFRKEIPYIKSQEMKKHPECRSYDQIPEKYKKLRIEYRIDNKQTPAMINSALKEFFAGLTYAEDKEQLADRLFRCMESLNAGYSEEEGQTSGGINLNDKETVAELIRQINEEENKRKLEEAKKKKAEEEKRKKEEAEKAYRRDPNAIAEIDSSMFIPNDTKRILEEFNEQIETQKKLEAEVEARQKMLEEIEALSKSQHTSPKKPASTPKQGTTAKKTASAPTKEKKNNTKLMNANVALFLASLIIIIALRIFGVVEFEGPTFKLIFFYVPKWILIILYAVTSVLLMLLNLGVALGSNRYSLLISVIGILLVALIFFGGFIPNFIIAIFTILSIAFDAFMVLVLKS